MRTSDPERVSFDFPTDLTPVVLVPLAAYLIEYPVASVPSSTEQTSFLSGQLLHVYEATIQDPSSLSSSHTLLKFSCPVVVTHESLQLSTTQVVERLQSRFSSRLENLGMVLNVHYHTVTLDRVAL
ncbi:hypothetical protein BV22DRAFT_1014611 [Leucogyrophana mollusca]|uniref:Uncharacterized protein n=1 Tax=Leucogyrophana mollusca TaxID=85980 RepID=A0ACB8BF19_9AGAM|nr:hypothetical protein BV22DRAFT_1014611 [Leucogyrophana mollusca]